MAATATLSEPVPVCDQNMAQEMEAVFSRCWSSFFRTAFRHLGNTADAEDAVQEALLSAYRHRNQFRGQAQMTTWITAIVVNSARMQLRRRSRVPHLSLSQEPEGEGQSSLFNLLMDRGPNPEQQCRASQLADRTAYLMARLSPRLRQAIQLRELQGLAIREIASMLSLPEGTVKARLARARSKLRHMVRKKSGWNVAAETPANASVIALKAKLTAIES